MIMEMNMNKIMVIGIIVFALLFAGCAGDTEDSKVLHWTFTDPITDVEGQPWLEYDYLAPGATNATLNKTNANYTNGMTFLASGNNMYWLPDEPSPGEGLSDGAVQPNGEATKLISGVLTGGFLWIGRIEGPFDITLKYIGIDTVAGRRPVLITNDAIIESGPPTTTTIEPVIWTYSYTRTLPITVTIGCTGGAIRLHDVIINFKERNY